MNPVYIDLLGSSLLMLIGVALFGKFERGGSAWRRIIRAVVLVGGTGLLSYFFGHWSLLLPLGMASVGSAFHFYWCQKHGINPFTAEPYDLYKKLRGWGKD